MQLATLNLKLKRSPRRELRYALLAAMESCWTFAILAFLAALMGLRFPTSPLTLFLAYWIALIAGRGLPRLKQSWTVLQAATIAIAIMTLLVIVRLEVYPRVGLFDLAWLPTYIRNFLAIGDSILSDHLVSAGVLYVFIRGLGFGQRPLTLWFVGFQFRLGIVAFFLLLLVSSFFKPYDASLWIVVYFFLSLLSISLARIDELESNIRFGPRWLTTLLASVALVLFLGLGLTRFFTLDAADALLRLFAPVWAVISGIILLLAIPGGIIVGWLFDLIMAFAQPIVRRIMEALENLTPVTDETTRRVQDQAALLEALIPILKILFVLGIIITIGYLLASALNRRMKIYEEDAFLRESIGADDVITRDRPNKKAKPPRRAAGTIAAENIRRIYAALVARAAAAGLPRRVAETPNEYLPRLTQTWSAEADDLRAITEAYDAVHYGEHDATPDEVSRVRAAWARVEQIIKRKT